LLPRLMAEVADPRDAWAEQVRVIVSSSRELQTLEREHPETAAELLNIMLTTLDGVLCDAYRRSDRIAAAQAIFDFSHELRRLAVAKMRARLPVQSADIVKARTAELERNAWAAREMDNLREMLRPGETITDISPVCIETSGNRTITREQVRAHGRPVSWFNDASWLGQFVGDAEVARVTAQNEARRNAPRPWADSGPRTRDNQPLQYDSDGKPVRRW